MDESHDTLALDLWQKYSVPSPHEDVEKYRNPYIDILVNYAKHTGTKLQKILDALDTTIVIGGSLSYKAAVRDCYDIDLRILFPASDNIESRMEKASNLLYEKAGFSEVRKIVEKFHDEDNIVYHLEWIDANGYREAKPDQKLEVLSQAKLSYPLFLKDKE